MSTATKQTRENRTITVDFRDDATYFRLLKDGKAFVQAGAGIVADSEPAREREETERKAMAVLAAIEQAKCCC